MAKCFNNYGGQIMIISERTITGCENSTEACLSQLASYLVSNTFVGCNSDSTLSDQSCIVAHAPRLSHANQESTASQNR